jgi:integrase
MKVRLVKYVSGTEKWMADLGAVNGKRVQRYFPTKELAEEEVRRAKGDVREMTSQMVSLSAGEKIRFQVARDELWTMGATIEDAVNFFKKHHHALKPASDLNVLSREYLDDLSRKKSSARYQRLTAGNLKKFLLTVQGKAIGGITREDIEEWVTDATLSAGTQANRLVTVRAFLQWAKKRRYISISPIEGTANLIELPDLSTGEIQSYGPNEVRALFHTALFAKYNAFDRQTGEFYQADYRDLLGYLTAACFCGVRPEEVARIELSRLDFVTRTLVVTKAAAKTSQTRVIELSRVAYVWFRFWRWCCPDSLAFIPVNFDRKWRALRKEAGLVKWVHDGLRHTFATMHYAAHQNAGQLKALMGHSQTEETLFRHYRAVVTVSGETVNKRMAKEFWNLTPKRVKRMKSNVPPNFAQGNTTCTLPSL